MPTLTPTGGDGSFSQGFTEQLNYLTYEDITDSSSSQVIYYDTVLKGDGFKVKNGVLTAGTITTITTSTFKATGLDIDATDLQAALDKEWLNPNSPAIESLIYGLSWTYEGTAGRDDVNFGFFTGDSTVDLGGDDDFYLGGSGDDDVRGGAGYDDITGNAGDDRLFGGDGGANLYGGDGKDTIDVGSGPGEVYGGQGKDTIDASQLLSAGVAYVFGDGGDDRITGGKGAVWAFGGDGNDSITGGKGEDSFEGDSGNDRLDGGAGYDKLLGDDGDDNLAGGADNDRLDGGAGNDALRGGNGTDSLLGSDGDDRLKGDDGADRLAGGKGRDAMQGGTGGDVFVFSSLAHLGIGSGRDVIEDFKPGSDRIDLSALDLEFQAGGAFTAKNQVRFDASTSLLLIETTGDGKADFAIELQGVQAIARDDLLL